MFLKPEWGQNAQGIFCAENAAQLRTVRERLRDARVPYLVQQGAAERREFEIFAIRSPETLERPYMFTVTEALNERAAHPVNSVRNLSLIHI